MRFLVLILTTILSFSIFAWDTPEQAITEYLKYDADGHRLGGSDWKVYTSTYLDVNEFYDEPGYDAATIINSFSVSKPICRPTTCIATVTYSLLNTSNISDKNIYAHPQGGFEKRLFTTTKIGNEWRIQSGMGNPFISSDTYKRHKAMQNGL